VTIMYIKFQRQGYRFTVTGGKKFTVGQLFSGLYMHGESQHGLLKAELHLKL